MKEYNVLKLHTTGILEEPYRSTINLCVSMACNNQLGIKTTTIDVEDIRTCVWVLDSLLDDEQLDMIKLFTNEILEDLDNEVREIEQKWSKYHKLF